MNIMVERSNGNSMRKIGMIIFAIVLLFNSALAVSGDFVRKYKTGTSSVVSTSVYSPIGSYGMYISAYGNDGYNLTMTLQGRNGVDETYKKISGTDLKVDHGATKRKTVYSSDYNFVRMKLSGLGHGVGELTAN